MAHQANVANPNIPNGSDAFEIYGAFYPGGSEFATCDRIQAWKAGGG